MGQRDRDAMNALASQAVVPRSRDLLEVVRVLVVLQAAVLVASTLEGLVFLAAFGPTAGPTVALTGLAAVITFAVASGIGRRSARARRITLLAEGGILLVAAVDLALSLLMTGTPLPLVPTIVRLVLPLAVIAILRDPEVRAGFMSVPAAPAPPAVAP
jgi:hypothetical protein